VWQRQLHAASRLLSMLAKLLRRSQPVYLQQQMCLLIRTPSGKQNIALQGCSITLSHLNMTDDLCTWQSMPLRQLLAFHSLVHLQVEVVANSINLTIVPHFQTFFVKPVHGLCNHCKTQHMSPLHCLGL